MQREKGFTLIEVAIVMIIIGLVMGGGMSIMRTLTDRKFRNESIDYLNNAKKAVITFSEINGRLPFADTDSPVDGIQNANATRGTLPYLDIGVKPSDAYKRPLAYEVNAGLITSGSVIPNMVTSCNALIAGLSGRPQVLDADAGAGSVLSVAAVIVSAGPMNADGAGGIGCFDAITGLGNNTSGAPNYIRNPPNPTFDDLVVYLSANELYGAMCETLVLTVVDMTPPTTFYVRDTTRGIDLGAASGAYTIISGTEIGIYNGVGGSGGVLPGTTPPTPVALAGQDYTISIP
jgi:prepilin-type N-terminal cleavage/methylation domain-containing protein